MAGRRAATRATVWRRWGRRRRADRAEDAVALEPGGRIGHRMAGVAIGAALALSACGDDGPPEPTVEERLAEIEGRTLSAGEVADLLAVGDALCQLDGTVLEQIWLRLDDDQLAFQDLVFEERCPERAILYAGHTGRYVTDEATESGVSTSTTRPITTTTRRSSTTRAIETSRSGPAFTTTSEPASSTTTSGSTSGSTSSGATNGSEGSVTATTATGTPSSTEPASTGQGEGG